jgi:N-carbamoylputrescine amidase
MNETKTYQVKTIRIAAIQVESQLGQIEVNLAHATPLAERAADEGAQLVLLPELFSSGYFLDRELWDAAEPRVGPTVRWLTETAARLGVWLGTSYLEAEGEHFFNTFVLATPEGGEAGRVRKRNAERYFFKYNGYSGSHVIPTPLGRLGVGICADNHFAFLPRLMQAESIDLMLMPHAWPMAWRPSRFESAADIERARRKAQGLAPLYADLLGVPAVFANQVGPKGFRSWTGLLGKLMNPAHVYLPGLSTIADSDGTIRGQLEYEEGLIVADVTLDPLRKRCKAVPSYGYYHWIHPGPPLRDAILGLDAAIGRLWYRFNRERRQKARQVSCRKVRVTTTAQRLDQ